MIVPLKNFRSVPFFEYIAADQANAVNNTFDIVVQGELSQDTYCTALYSKILTIGLSESVDFLDYQCSIHKSPVKWLNALEKIIKNNSAIVNTADMKHRIMKFMMEIITKRQFLKVFPLYQSKEKKLRETMNGYTGDKVYCFQTVLYESLSIKPIVDKVLYFKAHIKDYKQNPPEFESNRKPKFDEQCQLEINSISEEEELMQKALAKKKQSPKSINKLRVNAELKTLCDFYYRLMKKKGLNGQSIYPWTIKEATNFICNSFMDMDGAPFNRSTIRTYLSPSKFDSRPKFDKEFDLDDEVS